MNYINRYIFDPAGLNGGGVSVRHVFDQEGESINKEKSRLAIPGGLVYGGNYVDVIAAGSSSDVSGGSDDVSGGGVDDVSGGSNCSRASESIISDDLFDSLLKRVYTPNYVKTFEVTKTKTNHKRNKKNRTKKVTSK